MVRVAAALAAVVTSSGVADAPGAGYQPDAYFERFDPVEFSFAPKAVSHFDDFGVRLAQPMMRRGRREVGIASVYGPEDGGGTIAATGERIDHGALTAAHKTLPLGTLVEVTNLANRRHAVFRINDRGPFVSDRVIDLTEAGGRKLGVGGLAPVRLAVVPKDGCTFAERSGASIFVERAQAEARPGCPFDGVRPSVAEPAMARAEVMGTGGAPRVKKRHKRLASCGVSNRKICAPAKAVKIVPPPHADGKTRSPANPYVRLGLRRQANLRVQPIAGADRQLI